MSKPDQLYLSSDLEPPPDPDRDDAIETALDEWLEAKLAQKRASEATAAKHASLLTLLADRKLERYPFLDRTSGKKRYVVADKTPRAKVIKPPTVRGEKRKAKRAADKAEKVEVRRVSRKSVEDEIGPLDPFAAVRAQMGGR